jgi:hypothetical protein
VRKSDLISQSGVDLSWRLERRPHLASLCLQLDRCEFWRRQVLRETSDRVLMIQSRTLGEPRIREINDEINRLLRERRHWERRIRELGGPDYARIARGAGRVGVFFFFFFLSFFPFTY